MPFRFSTDLCRRVDFVSPTRTGLISGKADGRSGLVILLAGPRASESTCARRHVAIGLAGVFTSDRAADDASDCQARDRAHLARQAARSPGT